MSGRRIRFDPPAMLTASGRLLALSDDLGTTVTAVSAVSTAGFPPELASTARLVLSEVGCDLGTARATTNRQARAIATRAVRAIALDAGCDPKKLPKSLRKLNKGRGIDWDKFLKDLRDPNGWDAAGALLNLRQEGREWLKRTRADLGNVRRKLKWAQRYWDENAWVRRQFKSPRDLQRNAGKGLAKMVRDLEKRTRLLDRLDPAANLPKGLRNNPILKRAPLAGDLLTFGEGLGEGRSVPDAAGKAAAQRAGGAGGAALGGVACGTAAAATLGLGAATCPVLIGGGAIVGDFVVGKAYDPIIKPAGGAIVGGGKKVVNFVGGLID